MCGLVSYISGLCFAVVGYIIYIVSFYYNGLFLSFQLAVTNNRVITLQDEVERVKLEGSYPADKVLMKSLASHHCTIQKYFVYACEHHKCLKCKV